MKRLLYFIPFLIFVGSGCSLKSFTNPNTIQYPAQKDLKDGKIIMDLGLRTAINNARVGCDYKFNSTGTDRFDLYKNKNMTVLIPYNPNWGDKIYKLSVFDEYKDASGGVSSIDFGPTLTDLADNTNDVKLCTTILRKYALVFKPAQSLKNYLEDNPAQNVVQKKIGNLKVWEYQLGGDGLSQVVVVPGSKYNYEFSAFGPGARLVDLEQLILTVQLSN